MTQTIDCRKLQCPAPVLKTKKCLEKQAICKINIIVDNDAAMENVSRFLNSQGFEVCVDSDGITSTVSGKKDPKNARILKANSQSKARPDQKLNQENQKIMIMLSSEQIGKGDEDLGKNLMINFVKTLKEMGKDLWRLVLVNYGVKLSTNSSAVLEELTQLEQSGVNVLVCGACLTHLGLMDQKKAGQTTNMLDIVTSMQLADKVINL